VKIEFSAGDFYLMAGIAGNPRGGGNPSGEQNVIVVDGKANTKNRGPGLGSRGFPRPCRVRAELDRSLPAEMGLEFVGGTLEVEHAPIKELSRSNT